MKITKFEHACFMVEKDGQSLIVDPGTYTTNLVIPDNVTVIVITHEHADHMDKDLLKAIYDKNPNTVIVGHPSIVSQLSEYRTQSVSVNQGTMIGTFELKFYGGQHAVIMRDWPVIANLGVMINQQIYYPGDSFAIPNQPVNILALPVSAPWLKISEVIEFITNVQPKFIFPTHDAILSDIGKGLPDRMIPTVAEKIGAEYRRLLEPLEI
jgi:L-ascorbate metabolism protein UlaG (beta-lactamase superfamily)